MYLDRIAVGTAVAALAVGGCASETSAATPRAGKLHGATSQKSRLVLDVSKRHGKVRVGGAEFSVHMDCDDGSSIDRVVRAGSAKVSRAGRFHTVSATGGNFGAEGKIRVTVKMEGRFTASRDAAGTFEAGAVVSDSPISPAVSCSSGAVGWVV